MQKSGEKACARDPSLLILEQEAVFTHDKARAKSAMINARKKITRELVGNEPYEYYALGKFIVCAPGVCGGRPTFKYTRIEVEVALDLLAAGMPLEKLLENLKGRVGREAIKEALKLGASFIKRKAKAVTV